MGALARNELRNLIFEHKLLRSTKVRFTKMIKGPLSEQIFLLFLLRARAI